MIYTNSFQLSKCTKVIRHFIITNYTLRPVRNKFVFGDVYQLTINTFLKHSWTQSIRNWSEVFVLSWLLHLDYINLVTFIRCVNLVDLFEVCTIQFFCFLLRVLLVPSLGVCFLNNTIYSEFFFSCRAKLEVWLLKFNVAKYCIHSCHVYTLPFQFKFNYYAYIYNACRVATSYH
ncbi:hypothetical protein D3C81_1583560 [compost metagenome]